MHSVDAVPQAGACGILQPGDGFLYGAAELGGTGQEGCIFRISKAGSTFNLLHLFDRSVGDPGAPEAGLMLMRDGTLAGVVKAGGRSQLGTLFTMQKDGGN